jgi:HTH-type transcriptional regulator/antitoxin HigA
MFQTMLISSGIASGASEVAFLRPISGVSLVEAYERTHFPMDLPHPIEAIKFVMEQRGLSPKDLEPAIGRLNRVYEVLNRTRPLTLAMIRNLHDSFGIPAESLIKRIA